MDIKEKINEIVDKVKNDPKMMDDFKKDPVKTVEGIIGVDLPDDIVEKIVTGVKGKVTLDNASGIIGSLKGLMK